MYMVDFNDGMEVHSCKYLVINSCDYSSASVECNILSA